MQLPQSRRPVTHSQMHLYLMTTCHTLESTLRLAIDFICMTTPVTALTGILRIYKNHVAKLVIAIGLEPSPSSVESDAV